MKKITLGLIILILITGVSFGVIKSQATTSNQPALQTAQTQNLDQTITASGDIEAESQETLPFLSAGRVSYLAVKSGDQVSRGEVMAALDSTIASNTVQSADAQYKSAQAALNKVVDDIHLFQYGNGGFSNVGSANETQTQKTQRQQAEEAVNAAYDNLQSAKKQLDLLSIVAPFDGTVLSVQNIEVGTNASATGGSSITIISGQNKKFVAQILEQDLSAIKVGQSVTISLDSQKGQPIEAAVSKIAADKTVLTDGRVVFKVDVQSEALKDVQIGQTGTIEVSVGHTGVTTVPSWTVVNNSVWVKNADTMLLKQVQTGQTVNGQTEIISGLSEGDQVVTDPMIIAKTKYQLL